MNGHDSSRADQEHGTSFSSSGRAEGSKSMREIPTRPPPIHTTVPRAEHNTSHEQSQVPLGAEVDHYQSQPYSAGGSIDSIDLEKSVLRADGRHERRTRDSARQSRAVRESRRLSKRHEMVEKRPGSNQSNAGSVTRVDGGGNAAVNDVIEDDDDVEDEPMKLLIFFSGPAFALSLLFCLWTFISLLFALLLQPFRLCASRPGLHAQISSLLAPALAFQLDCINSDLHVNTCSLPMLLVVHLLSPALACGIAVWSWVVAVYWIMSRIVGNPDGLDGRNDGRELVLSMRLWWEGWLKTALVD